MRGLLAAALLAGSAPTVGAHAEIRESDPAADGTVGTGIDEISMTFISFDPRGPVDVAVLDTDGNDHAVGEPEVSARDSVVTQATEPLEEGNYSVEWSALSDDGDGISTGSFSFEAEDRGGGVGIWLIWIVALAIPAVIFLRPGKRKR